MIRLESFGKCKATWEDHMWCQLELYFISFKTVLNHCGRTLHAYKVVDLTYAYLRLNIHKSTDVLSKLLDNLDITISMPYSNIITIVFST